MRDAAATAAHPEIQLKVFENSITRQCTTGAASGEGTIVVLLGAKISVDICMASL